MFFGDDFDQFSDALNKRGHIAKISMSSTSTFEKLTIMRREGIKSFKQYLFAGLQLDGTFIMTQVCRVLLVTCFRNGNGKLQIVGCAVVSIENQSNWFWFLNLLIESFEFFPSSTKCISIVIVSGGKKHLFWLTMRILMFLSYLLW
jgi:hypothetical protein